MRRHGLRALGHVDVGADKVARHCRGQRVRFLPKTVIRCASFRRFAIKQHLHHMKPRIAEQIREAGLEFMGCYRATDGVCYYLGGLVDRSNYGNKEGYRLNAWKEHSSDELLLDHAATALFYVSASAMATGRVRGLIAAQ